VSVFLEIVKICAILIASAMLGNWFFSEVKACRHRGDPWYAPYISLPGILIVSFVILIPILAWLFRS